MDEFWLAELQSVTVEHVGALTTELVLPDPFGPTGVGAVAGWLARRKRKGAADPAPTAAEPSGTDRVGVVAKVTDTSASMVQRLVDGCRRG